MIKNILMAVLLTALGLQYWFSHKKINFDENLYKQVLEQRFKNTVKDDPFNPYICLSHMQQQFENDALSEMGAWMPRNQLTTKSWARLNAIGDEIAKQKHQIVEDRIRQRNEKQLH